MRSGPAVRGIPRRFRGKRSHMKPKCAKVRKNKNPKRSSNLVPPATTTLTRRHRPPRLMREPRLLARAASCCCRRRRTATLATLTPRRCGTRLMGWSLKRSGPTDRGNRCPEVPRTWRRKRRTRPGGSRLRFWSSAPRPRRCWSRRARRRRSRVPPRSHQPRRALTSGSSTRSWRRPSIPRAVSAPSRCGSRARSIPARRARS